MILHHFASPRYLRRIARYGLVCPCCFWRAVARRINRHGTRIRASHIEREFSMSTIEELKKLRDELIERRRDEAYMVGSAFSDECIAKLNGVHTAIIAIDAVIAEGKDQAEHGSSVGNLPVI